MANIYMRVTGNDANDGSTPALAVATLARAQVVATAGDTIYIGAGTYSGTAPALTKNNLIILGDPLGTATGDAGLAIIYNPAAYPAQPFYGSTATGITIKKLIITTVDGAYVMDNRGTDNSTWKFIDCVIWGGYGLAFGGSYINCTLYGAYGGYVKPQLWKNCVISLGDYTGTGTPVTLTTNYTAGYATTKYIDPANNDYRISFDYNASIKGAGTTDANLTDSDILGKLRDTADPYIGPYDAGSYVTDKLLLRSGSAIYTLSAGATVSVGYTPATEEMFATYGLNDLSSINDTTIRLLTNPIIMLRKV